MKSINDYTVGEGVTMHQYSDSHAGTVVAVSKSGKRVAVQRDKAKLSDSFKPDFIQGGFAGHCTNQSDQSYSYKKNSEGAVTEYSLRKWRGGYVWTRIGDAPNGIQALQKGRNEFHDYNF